MTFSVVPYALQNAAHSAALFRQATSSFVPPAGGLVTYGDLNVTQTGTASMNVVVGVGRIWIPGTSIGNVAGGNFSSQAMYYGQNAAAYTCSVDTSDNVNPRIDVVYAAVQDSYYAGSLNAGVLSVAKGIPASGATYPANAPSLPANAIALAWILVPANAASIITSYITNLTPTLSVTPSPDIIATNNTDATWAYNCVLERTTSAANTQQFVNFQFLVARTSGGAFTVSDTVWTGLFAAGFIPANYRPTDSITQPGTFEFAPGSPAFGLVHIQVRTDGSVWGRAAAGTAFSAGTPAKLTATMAWRSR